MQKDSNSAWLIIRSDKGLCSDEIGVMIGISSNSRTKNHPQGGKSFFLKSDSYIEDVRPLTDHINWLVDACSTNLGRIRDFVNEPGNSGEIFVYAFTEHSAGYVEMSAAQLRFFSECGLSLNVKIETGS